MKRGAIGCLLACVVGLGSTASADDADRRARELFQQGDAAYASGNYEKALDAFQRAYSLSSRPALLYNIGNTLDRLDRIDEAADAFRRYRPHAPESELRTLDARIANLEAEWERLQLQRHEDAPRSRNGKLSATTIALVSGAGGMLAVGLTFASLTARRRSKIGALCENHLCQPEAQSLLDQEKKFGIIADVGFAVGAGLAGAGIYFLVRDLRKHKRNDEQQLSLTPMVSPDGAGLQLRGAL